MYLDVQTRFRAETATGQVEFVRDRSLDAAERFPTAFFDWVYVDGDHLYEQVSRDLEVYAARLKVPGVLAGDDYGVAGFWGDGVRRAVDDFAAKTGWELQLLGRSQFLLRRSK